MNHELVLPQIYSEEIGFAFLQQFIQQERFAKEMIFVLADENTERYCLPLLTSVLQKYPVEVIRISSGEVNKNLASCTQVWEKLTACEAGRQSLLINLGGGMISDLGGFAASVYKRGIPFIHIPTTLLSMTDASIGGKTGVDFNLNKNHLGTFTMPEAVFIYPGFLKTLDERVRKSGIAEMIKHALVADTAMWDEMSTQDEHYFYSDETIRKSIAVKMKIVQEDPDEKGVRKILNFGHTTGHALESFSLKHDADPLLHGEAVACGMLIETKLSELAGSLSSADGKCIRDFILKFFKGYSCRQENVNELVGLMRQDKKNRQGKTGFILLIAPGYAGYDFFVDEKQVEEVLIQELVR